MIWAGLAGASVLAGFLKGVTGFGGALVLSPFFVLLIGPRDATVLIILIHAFTCLQGARNWWHSVRWPAVGTLALIAVFCAAVVSLQLDRVDVASAKRITGGVIIVLAALQLSGWRWRHKGGWLPMLVTGFLSGAFTAAAGTGGPPAVVYFSGTADGKESIRANLLAFFVLLFTLSAAALAWQQRINYALFLKSLVLSPVFFTGAIYGERLFLRMENRHFDRLVAAILIGSGAAILLA